MARIKKEAAEETIEQQPVVDETVDQNPTDGEVTEQQPVVDETVDPVLDNAVKETLKEIEETVLDSPKTPKPPVTSDETKETSDDQFVDSILKSFPNYPELYISDRGGVYSPGTKPDIRGAAILYKNPYFNNLKQN